MDLLEIDDVQARAILDMQLRKLAALERQQLTDEYEDLMAQIANYQAILASPSGSGRSSAPSWARSWTGTATTGARRSSPTTATCPSRT